MPDYAKQKNKTNQEMINPIKSVGLKLFLLISFSIVTCVMTVGLIAYSQAKILVEKKVTETSFQTVNQVVNSMDNVFQMYMDMTLQILFDKAIIEELDKLSNSNDQWEIITSSRTIYDRLTNYRLGNSSIMSIALIPVKEGKGIISSGNNGGKSIETMSETDWFKKTQELDGHIVWIEPQAKGLISSNHNDSIGLSRIMKTKFGELVYVLVMEIRIDAVQSHFENVHFGEGSTLALVNSSGEYVVYENRELLGQPHLISFPSEGDALIKGGDKYRTSDGDEVLAVYQLSELTDWKFAATLPVEKLVEDAKVIRNLTWLMVVFAALIAGVIGSLVIITITRPLAQLRNLMAEGASGNLTVRSNMKKRLDEIGQLSDSFNDMMMKITALAMQTTHSATEVLQTASNLTEASRKTAVAAKEIAVATDEIANGANSLAMEAEKGTHLTEHMNEQMKQVIASNKEMVGSAAEVEQASERGAAYMIELIKKTGVTEEMTRSMVKKVDALRESTGSIVKILEVLNNLTKQTNILSLNAAIEAARAGAAGKGFMVVSDEIRKLAIQSRQSIDIVGQITENIQGEIEETVRVLSEAYPMFQEQIASVKEANQIFLTVQGEMGHFVETLELVTSSIGELNQSQSDMSEAMTNVSAVAEQSSATSEEVASLSSEQLSVSDNLVRLSEKLDSVSKGLKESLSKFKVE